MCFFKKNKIPEEFSEIEQAEKLYNDLKKAGFEVLYDDREASAGEKFADSDLIGCPYRLIISAKTLKEGKVELKKRKEKDFSLISLEDVVETLKK